MEILPSIPLQLLVTHNFVPCFLFAHIFSMNKLPSHIRTNVFSHTLLLLLRFLGLKKTHPIHPLSKLLMNLP